MKVISKPYVMIISISIVLGLVLGHLLSDVLMNSLWQHYVDPNTLSYLLPLLLILIAAGVTVTGKIYRAASQNPARSLKDE
jgi:ABC-type antimicrobial peptide transport system permease subunit